MIIMKWAEGDGLCFNPLTGIRSFLTDYEGEGADTLYYSFQSPHGDSFFSDEHILVDILPVNVEFQSPHGDSFFSDAKLRKIWLRGPDIFVSIPSRGFVLF